MADEVNDFLNSFNAWVQEEVTRLSEDLAYSRLVHAARSSVEALAEKVREEVENAVAVELGIED